MDIKISPKQRIFLETDADEVLFGGAAAGGKSYGQLIDALLYALKYPKSKQLILRRKYVDLERSLLRQAREFYPSDVCKYNETKHTYNFVNRSLIEFGYCDSEKDVTNYKSAEYDVIRFDELTTFTKYMYTYMLSRLRGANNYPKQLKSTTNPGDIGHEWVKERFVSPSPPYKKFEAEHGSRIFIPSFVEDNIFLMRKDPDYKKKRLENLPSAEKKALLYGDWNILEGQYFAEFSRVMHVCEPFSIPDNWTRYRVLDYGLDMLACYWIAVDPFHRAWVYRELYESGLIVSAAAQRIRECSYEPVRMTLAPPDLWGRSKDSGKTMAELFALGGVPLTASKNDRVNGWMAVKELLKVAPDERGEPTAGLCIFDNCVNLIRCLPALQRDKRNVSDVAGEPHELTHGPDALRYFASHIRGGFVEKKETRDYDRQIKEFLTYGY